MGNFLEELEKAKIDNRHKLIFWLAMLVNAIVLITIICLAK